MARKALKSELGWSTVDQIVVRGKDLPGEILGHLNLGHLTKTISMLQSIHG